MPSNDFDGFRELVMSDAALREELRAIQDRVALRERLMVLGRERGFAFTEADVEAAAQSMRQAWIERWLYQ